MKIRLIVFCCLMVLAALYVGNDVHESSSVIFAKGSALASLAKWAPNVGYDVAGPVAGGSNFKIGVVGLRGIFRNSKRSTAYRQRALAERQATEARLDQLTKEIEADEAGLRTLKPTSTDYLEQLRGILQKKSQLRTEQEFYNQRVSLREQSLTEGLYKDVLQAVSEVAQQKGLDLVLEKSEPEIPASSPTQLELAMGTHKVLYSGGCLDITDEVMKLVDAKADVGSTN